MNISKKIKKIQSEVDLKKSFKLTEAVELSKKFSTSKFDESIDLSIVLGIDAKKTDQLVRGVLSLPRGVEKKINYG